MATILLIEDELLLAKCYARWLTTAGHSVQHASDAQTAIEAVDDALPHAIVLDIMLPGANGIQLLHTLRSYADLSTIPVVICSNALPEHMPDMALYGVRGVLDKTTLDRGQLCAALAGVL